MRLTIRERFILRSILPSKSGIVTAMLVEKLNTALAPTLAEIDKWHIHDTAAGPSWGVELDAQGVPLLDEAGRPVVVPGAGTATREFKFSNAATETIRTALKELDSEKKLVPDHVSLWRKFFDEGGAEDAVAVGEEDLPEAIAARCSGAFTNHEEGGG